MTTITNYNNKPFEEWNEMERLEYLYDNTQPNSPEYDEYGEDLLNCWFDDDDLEDSDFEDLRFN